MSLNKKGNPMPDDVMQFYNAMADDYHLIFADWQASVERQGAALDQLIRRLLPPERYPPRVLDCACGIGTQAIGLAKQSGYAVHATDISAREVERARQEATNAGVSVTFGVADIRSLSQSVEGTFDVVIAYDNAIPHLLTDEELDEAARQLFAVTHPGGVFLASTRDYDELLLQRPRMTSERVIDSPLGRRITFQLWDWEDEEHVVTQFILTLHPADGWTMKTYTTRYRALRRSVLSEALERAGFHDVRWLKADEAGFYQPVVVAWA
jgi:SAM-dependent methyltransferase